MRFSFGDCCAVYDQEPATFECRICGEVENDLTFDQNQDVCDQCQNKLAGKEIEDRKVKLSDVVCGVSK